MRQICLLLASLLLTTVSFAKTNNMTTRGDATLDALRGVWKSQQTTHAENHNGIAMVYGGADVSLNSNSKSQYIPV